MVCVLRSFPHCFTPDDDLEKLIVDIIQANNRGVSAAKNVTSEPNWSFGQSFFFSSTIVTTIGNAFVREVGVRVLTSACVLGQDTVSRNMASGLSLDSLALVERQHRNTFGLQHF